MLGAIVWGAGLGLFALAGNAVGAAIVIGYGALGLVVAALPPLVLGSRVFSPLSRLRDTIGAMNGDGDLSRRAPEEGSAAVRAAARTFNELMQSFQGIIGKVSFNSKQVAQAADKL